MKTQTFTVERIYTGTAETSNALNAAADPKCTRDIMAVLYCDCLIAHAKKLPVDFKAINEAILNRWPKGLNYIKNKAWRMKP